MANPALPPRALHTASALLTRHKYMQAQRQTQRQTDADTRRHTQYTIVQHLRLWLESGSATPLPTATP